MIIGILVVGFLLLGLVIKLVEGTFKFILIAILLILIIGGSIFSSHNDGGTPAPSASLSAPSIIG